MNRSYRPFCVLALTLTGLLASASTVRVAAQAQTRTTPRANKSVQRLLYVASPGIRDYLEYGGHGILVFDIDDGHKFVRRISLDGHGVDERGKPSNVKGVCANAETHRVYVSTQRHLICLDLLTDKCRWQR